jgi:hypothetical protein
MAIAEAPKFSLGERGSYNSRLVRAFVLSLILHAAIYGTYQGGKKLGIWEHLHWPAWMKSAPLLSKLLNPTPPPRQQPAHELPIIFVDVNPAQAAAEAPKNAKYYSDKNSRAANPNPSESTETPKIEGKQNDMVKTEDVPRSKAFPLNPTIPKPESKEEQVEQKPKPAQPVGDLAFAKPIPSKESKPQKEIGEDEHARPRTLKEARARQPNNQLAGQKMKQEGGVRNAAVTSSLDVASTVFGAYDAKIIAAIQNRWYSLLDEQNFGFYRSGRVSVRFRLHADGSVTQLEFAGNEVGVGLGLLCQSAIKDPSPFEPWPGDMRREIGSEYRDVTFTFIYY